MNLKFKFLKEKKENRFFAELFADYVNPLRDWTFALVMATVLFFGWALYIAFDFYTQYIDPQSYTDVESNTLLYRDKEVLYYVGEYNKKEEEFQKLRGRKVEVPAVLEEELTGSREEKKDENIAPLAQDPVAE